MDAMVTARVPVEVKERVSAKLREAGSSPTELVNAAFEYYLHCGELPQAYAEAGPVCITLTPEQVEQLMWRARHATCKAPTEFWNQPERGYCA